MLKEYALEIDKLHAQLWAAREKDGVYLPADQYQAMERDLNEVRGANEHACMSWICRQAV